MFPNASTNATNEINFPTVESRKDPNHTMRALEWHGNKDVRIAIRPKPMVTDPGDAIIKITSTTICGSDLHLYHHEFQGLKKHDVLGHEFMGIVESIGPNVKDLHIGDKVVVSAVIADGTCYYCQNGLFSCCDTTNNSLMMEKLYGHRTAGLFGYSHLTGGYEGGQAEYARVPYADVNCLVVPQGLPDEKVLFLSDIACTGWHANELGGVHEGQTVAIWGAGPVGLMAAMWAKFRGAERIIMIDAVNYRLQLAQKHLGAETINLTETDTIATIQKLVPNGPDVCIDAVGFRYAKGIVHKLQRLMRIETDTNEILKECIICVRKGGSVSVVGDYYSTTNAFPIGAFMEKGLTMRGGQVHIQQYWKKLLSFIEKGEVDPTWVITHTMGLDQAPEAYKMFDEKFEDTVKIILKP